MTELKTAFKNRPKSHEFVDFVTDAIVSDESVRSVDTLVQYAERTNPFPVFLGRQSVASLYRHTFENQYKTAGNIVKGGVESLLRQWRKTWDTGEKTKGTTPTTEDIELATLQAKTRIETANTLLRVLRLVDFDCGVKATKAEKKTAKIVETSAKLEATSAKIAKLADMLATKKTSETK